jgi:putative solute:sodium symporter small subunit
MAAQGTLFIYLIIVGLYAWRMPRLDKMLKDENADGK